MIALALATVARAYAGLCDTNAHISPCSITVQYASQEALDKDFANNDCNKACTDLDYPLACTGERNECYCYIADGACGCFAHNIAPECRAHEMRTGAPQAMSMPHSSDDSLYVAGVAGLFGGLAVAVMVSRAWPRQVEQSDSLLS